MVVSHVQSYTFLVNLAAFRPLGLQHHCSQHRRVGNSNRTEELCWERTHAASRSASTAMQPQDENYTEEFVKIYERETPVISTLLEEIEGAGMVYEREHEASGTKYIEAEKRKVVREAVDRHFEKFSEAIIVVLAGYAQASYSEGHEEVAETLVMIREEVLSRSLSQLPPEMQALEHLIGMFDRTSAERVLAVKELGTVGRAGIPQADLAALRTTASQMLEDMEDKGTIVDSCLLAKLCIVREELDMAAAELNLLDENSSYYDLMVATWRLLPLGPAGFVKELLHVSLPDKRKGLLAACIQEDFQNTSDVRLRRWAQEGVRPGRLMNTIAALLSGLKHEGLQPDSKEVVQLRSIKEEAIKLLFDMANRELQDT